MRAFCVVLTYPCIEIRLQFIDRSVDLLAEGNAVKLVEHRLVQALNDPVRLRALGLGPRVVDVFDREVQLVRVLLGIPAVFGSSIGKHSAHADVVLFEEGKNSIVQDICRCDRSLLRVKLCKRNFAVGVNECLLVDAPDAFERANVEGVLSAAVAGAFALKLAVRILLVLRLLQRGELRFGENQALLRALCLKRFQSFLHGLEIVPLPNAADAGGRDRHGTLLEFVRDAHLAECRLLDCQSYDRILDRRVDSVLHDGFAAGDFSERRLTAGFVELLEAIEAIATKAHHLAGLLNVAELLCKIQQPNLRTNDFAFGGQDRLLRRRRQPRDSAGFDAIFANCPIKS